MHYRSLLWMTLAACGSSPNVPTGDAGEPDATTTFGPTFRFAIVGDTRPPNEDDVAGYPTPIITKIWSDVEAATPHVDFAVSTGDYFFASPFKDPTTIDAQLDLYLGARAKFSKAVFPAFGNHECTGATASNCGQGAKDGITPNYAAYMKRMVNPRGFTLPYYSVMFTANDGSWTAKLVVIAANAWSDTQATWLDQALTPPTTYTFVMRHESASANTAPGVTPSEPIIAAHPMTLKIVGHTHTYQHIASNHEVICGNGGAPLSGGINYGYAIAERLTSGAIQLTEYDYMTNAVVAQWRVNADGSAAP